VTRVVITGASGFVGGRLLEELNSRAQVTGTRYRHAVPGLDAVDLADDAAAHSFFRARRPEAVINCAALADPDVCEKDSTRARRLNTWMPALMGRLCAENGARLIHLSTDLVFDGKGKSGGYSEDDEALPLSEYGRSKLDGERALLADCPDAAIVRVSLVYGRARSGRPSFLDWLLGEIGAGRRAKLFTDQWRTPTPVSQLSEVMARLIETPKIAGVFHWGGADRVSRMDFGRAACRIFGLPETSLEPVSMADFAYAAARPADCALRCDKLSQAIGLTPLSLEAGLSAER
jgi:dTDP-4-dehydrorhamnose reductase